MRSAQLEEQLKALPASPGVYLFKDEQGKVIYAGKAANLSNRIRSYFGVSSSLSSKIRQLVLRTKDLEFMVTDSEQEALILECNMIKKHHPRYNVRLKDDKTFPYLKIAINEDWPGVYITRRLEKDGAKYFGPFASAGSVRKTLRLIKKIFPFRSCTKAINSTDKRPCLDFYIHRCLGPCIGAVSKKEYQEVINQVILFLEGKQELVLHELNSKMRAAAQELQFEKAALLRDQIHAIERVIEGQKIAITLRGEQDVIALARNGGQAYVEVFFVRNSKLVGRDHFLMEGVRDEAPNQIMTCFVKQYYASAPYIPPIILLQYPVEEVSMVTKWLKKQKGDSVKLRVPRKGLKKQLINMVAENASKGLQLAKVKQQMNVEAINLGLQELKERLHLARIPLRLECYDISDIGGAFAVGSMVVLERGWPKPTHYRRFRIKSVAGANDYAMIREVLRRRFKRAVIAKPIPTLNEVKGRELDEAISQKDSWAIIPDLILIDGGKGHLATALQARRELGIDSIPVVSLAKENEDVFIPGEPGPVDIPKDSPGLQMLQRARDEAHRFAISYHHKLRRREVTASILDSIPGIGPKRKKALLKRFGSIEAIKEASPEELSQLRGVNLTLAYKVKQYL